MIRALAGLATLAFLASACAAEPLPVTREEAISEWNKTYQSDCYAPRDLGTANYDSDGCWLRKAVNVLKIDDREYCFTVVDLYSSQWPDGSFQVGDIEMQKVCYLFDRWDDSITMLYSNANPATHLGILDEWPEGGL